MEEIEMIMENMNNILLDFFTIEELLEKGIKEINYEWKFNFSNSNVIPVLELYKKDKIYKRIEAIEFSEQLQELLEDSKMLFNQTSKPLNLEERKEILNLLNQENNCNDCDRRDVCFLRRENE